MKPLCFIAAEGLSTDLQRINSKLLAGKPLIAYTLESAIESKIFSHVVVSTDDAEIATIAKECGAEVPFIRPKRLTGPKSNITDVLLHGIKKLYSLGYNFDVFVYRDCTAPFIRNTDIRKAINLLKKQKCDMVIGVYKQHHNPYANMLELDSKGFVKIHSRNNQWAKNRKDVPTMYQSCGLCAYDAKRFLKYGKLIMPKTLSCEIPSWSGLKINTDFEYKIAESIITGVDGISSLIH